MQYRTLGRTGLRISEVGCGGAPIGIPNYVEIWDPLADESARSAITAIRRGIELGVNYFDTAPGYGAGRSEELIGAALAGGRRRRVYLATKTPWHGRTKQDVLRSVEDSLRRLQTDYVDVLQVHGDTGYAYTAKDYQWIIEGGVLDAYRQLIEEGKVRFIGITSEEPVSLYPFLETNLFDLIQIKYNVINQGAFWNILPSAEKLDVGVVVMRPLTSGIFQKLMRAAQPEIDKYVDLNQLALNYVLSDPRVTTAIVGMRRVSEMEANNALSDDRSKRFNLSWLQERRFQQ